MENFIVSLMRNIDGSSSCDLDETFSSMFSTYKVFIIEMQIAL